MPAPYFPDTNILVHAFEPNQSEKQTLARDLMANSAPWQSALQIQQTAQYRFHDSLIISAALRSGASRLYPEDLQHSHRIHNLEIINPFLP